MNETEQIRKFYRAFAALDSETMVSLYDDAVEFEDPAFGKLHGAHAGNMWRMLCHSQKGRDFRVDVSDIQNTDGEFSATWEAHYRYSGTGRKVHNVIRARFRFSRGKICYHRDTFDLYRWSRQALGLPGYLIGWTGFFRSGLQRRTHDLLRRFEEKMPP